MSTAETLLEVEDLVTRYPVPRGFVGAVRREPKLQVHAVEGVTFNVAPGEMLALVGESGCGKTTTAQTRRADGRERQRIDPLPRPGAVGAGAKRHAAAAQGRSR